MKPPAGLQLATEPAEGKIALLRIADKNGQTRKTCNGPAPAHGSRAGTERLRPTARAVRYDWWFTATGDAGDAVEVSKFIYINHATGNCEANPGETYSADYIALNPPSGCTTRDDCQRALGRPGGGLGLLHPAGHHPRHLRLLRAGVDAAGVPDAMSPEPRPGALLALLAALALACESVPSDAVTRCEATRVVPAAVKTDILFVIDDSGSMDEEQANLRDNLSAFIDALVAAPIANEFQIGVTTTSVEELRRRPRRPGRRTRPVPPATSRTRTARSSRSARPRRAWRTRATSSGRRRRVRRARAS